MGETLTLERACKWFEDNGVKAIDWIWDSLPVVLAVSLIESILYAIFAGLKYAFWGIYKVLKWFKKVTGTIEFFFGDIAFKLKFHIEDRLRSKFGK